MLSPLNQDQSSFNTGRSESTTDAPYCKTVLCPWDLPGGDQPTSPRQAKIFTPDQATLFRPDQDVGITASA